MRTTRLALLPVLAVLPWASAGGPTGLPAFRGSASPVLPPTNCRSTLERPQRSGTLYVYGKQLRLASPLQVSSCWRGRLNNKPFTLLGYANTTNDAAVLVQYGRQHAALIPLGNGTPTVTSFTGNAVCFIPNLAKGVAYPVNIATGRLLEHADQVCQTSSAASATFVAGLKAHDKVGAGVINRAHP